MLLKCNLILVIRGELKKVASPINRFANMKKLKTSCKFGSDHSNLGNCCSWTHGNSNIGFLQGRCIIDAIACHSNLKNPQNEKLEKFYIYTWANFCIEISISFLSPTKIDAHFHILYPTSHPPVPLQPQSRKEAKERCGHQKKKPFWIHNTQD